MRKWCASARRVRIGWRTEQNRKTEITFSFMHFNLEVNIFSFSLALDAVTAAVAASATDADAVDVVVRWCCANRISCDGHFKTTSSSPSENPLPTTLSHSFKCT